MHVKDIVLVVICCHLQEEEDDYGDEYFSDEDSAPRSKRRREEVSVPRGNKVRQIGIVVGVWKRGMGCDGWVDWGHGRGMVSGLGRGRCGG